MKSIAELKNDEYINERLQGKKLPENFYVENQLALSIVAEDREKCSSCSGLEECTLPSRGQRRTFSYTDSLSEEIEYCPYARKIVLRKRIREIIEQKRMMILFHLIFDDLIYNEIIHLLKHIPLLYKKLFHFL